jgi:hypothetical protein
LDLQKNNVRKLAKIIIDNNICARFHFTRNKREQKSAKKKRHRKLATLSLGT